VVRMRQDGRALSEQPICDRLFHISALSALSRQKSSLY
jgi:hypothetical protein